MSSTASWNELQKRQEDYIRLLELRCELLQREVSHLRQQVTHHLAAQTLAPLPGEIQPLLGLQTIPEVLHFSCSLLRQWTDAAASYALRLFPDGSMEVHPESYSEHARALVEEGILDWLAERGSPALLPDLFHGTTGSLLLVPLGHSGERRGALVGLSLPAALPESLIGQLHSLGILVSILLDNIESLQTAQTLHRQLQQLQQQLRQAESLATMGKITGIVVHEVGNPLQALLSYADLIESGHGDVRTHARSLREELLRLQKLLSQLRQLLVRPGDVPTLSPTDVGEVLRQTLQLLHPQFQRDRIRVQLEVRCPSPIVQGNAEHLKQLFLNLFLNARDAMPGGGTLSVELEADGNCLRIRCSDTGHGIPEDLLPRVFEPFVTTKPQGSGLGLSLVREIVEEHNGTVTIASQPGSGTTVTICLPLLQQTQPSATG